MSAPTVSTPLLYALLDQASKNGRSAGVLGVRAAPRWDGPPEFKHQGSTVRVIPCVSALAVREALRERTLDGWLILLTDAPEESLGLSIRARLSNHQFVSPDSWQAVQELFKAVRLEYQLVTQPQQRDVAGGILAVSTSGVTWPPAPAGLLTTEHVFSVIARRELLLDPDDHGVDQNSLLRWTASPDAAGRLADLRARAGDPLTDALIAWLASRGGRLQEVLGRLFIGGRLSDVIPLGLVARAVSAAGTGSEPSILLKKELGTTLDREVLDTWADSAEGVTAVLVSSEAPTAAGLLARGEQLLREFEALDLAAVSAVLRTGLEHRCGAVADACSRAVSSTGDVDRTVLAEAETALLEVDTHVLARRLGSATAERVRAAVRLLRWCATTSGESQTSLAADVADYVTDASWVDRALSAAWPGGDDRLAKGLRAAVQTAVGRREPQRRRFAQTLAATGASGWPIADGVLFIEELLESVVRPLAAADRVLLIVADGMSVPVATAVAEDVSTAYDTWQECLPAGRSTRLSALAVLPSLTEFCRTSLFAGGLQQGSQAEEKKLFPQWCTSRGLQGKIFHKKELDASPSGFLFAGDVVNAVRDTHVDVVACVLNTVDDALDRSDPGGLAWDAAAIKHLRPLLDLARSAGRVVVLTSDHGHVVERRVGRTLPGVQKIATSNRSRTASPEAQASEVAIGGRRVLPAGSAVLLVDEDVRYQVLKAGYHGGASPAEVVIPVNVFTPGAPPAGWEVAPPQSPAWWREPLVLTSFTPAVAPPPARKITVVARDQDTLFPAELPAPPAAPAVKVELVSVLQKSTVYKEQQKRVARRGIADEKLAALLSVLLAKPARRVAAETAAAALGVATNQLPGALPLVQRILNVEQYPVISRDAGTGEVVLDEVLLREQFGIL